MNDTIVCLEKFMRNEHFPPLFQLIVYPVLHGLNYFIKNMTITFACWILGQIFLCAFCVSYFIHWLYKRNVNQILQYLAILWLAFMPLIGDYVIHLGKDTWFSFSMLLLLPALYDYYEYGKLNRMGLLALFIGFIGVSFFRTNGILVGIFICVALLFKWGWKNKVVICLIACLLSFLLSLGYIMNQRIYKKVYFREMSSIVLAQIGASLNANVSLDEHDKNVLNQIFDLNVWKNNYYFSNIDVIKFNYPFNDFYYQTHQKEILTAWFHMGLKNPMIYLKAYIYHTYYFWALKSQKNIYDYRDQSVFTKINNNFTNDTNWGKWCQKVGLANQRILPKSLQENLSSFLFNAYQWNLHISPGYMLWVLLLTLMMCFIKKNGAAIVSIVCILLPTLTMLFFAPSCFIYRYSIYLLICLPFAVLVMLYAYRNNKIKNV